MPGDRSEPAPREPRDATVAVVPAAWAPRASSALRGPRPPGMAAADRKESVRVAGPWEAAWRASTLFSRLAQALAAVRAVEAAESPEPPGLAAPPAARDARRPVEAAEGQAGCAPVLVEVAGRRVQRKPVRPAAVLPGTRPAQSGTTVAPAAAAWERGVRRRQPEPEPVPLRRRSPIAIPACRSTCEPSRRRLHRRSWSASSSPRRRGPGAPREPCWMALRPPAPAR